MDIWRQAGSVLLVFALLGALLWTLRRKDVAAALVPWRKALGQDRELVVLERMALTPQHSLHLVRISGREVVVATYPSGFTVLAGGPLLSEAATETKKEADP